MVPGQGARAGDRHLQRRCQCRRDRHPAARAVAGARLWLADGVRGHRRRRLRLADRLVGPLSPPVRTSEAERRRTRLDRAGPRRPRRPAPVEAVDPRSRDLGLCGRQILHRPDLVVLPLLAARSEEHTSELQSLMRISYAVFCLKKKKLSYQIHIKFNTSLTPNIAYS